MVERGMKEKDSGVQYVASLSYGKDSLAMIHVIKDVLHKPLDRIITADIWATDEIEADLPPMCEFKHKADRIIKERWGIEVEHYTPTKKDGSKKSYEWNFYKIRSTGKYINHIYGFPTKTNRWCTSLKNEALNNAKRAQGKNAVSYIGIAADEPERIARWKGRKEMPLVDAGWTEAMCRSWCEENDLLSPLYQTFARGGCWFCHFQGLDNLRTIRKNYPDLWNILLRWDKDSELTFRPNDITVHDLDRRFQMEDEGYFQMSKFRWGSLDAAQMNMFQFMGSEDDEST